jgi:AcrR family transcriptional regulator
MADAEVRSGWDRRRYLLLTEYERIGLEQFATRGFKEVTFDDVAEVVGVSARSLFRYSPTKEDFLLGLPRRGLAAAVEMISALEPSDTPLEAAWEALQAFFSQRVTDVDTLTLWRRAAADAPDVVAQVRGERVQSLLDALTDYCASSLHVDAATDVRPRLLAGIIAGAELAVVEMLSRSEMSAPEILHAVGRTHPPPPIVCQKLTKFSSAKRGPHGAGRRRSTHLGR